MDIKALAQDAAPYVVERRHYYHQHPELTGEEKNTRDAIHRDLEALGITDIRDMVNCYGLVATIHGGKPGKTVGLRADTDALSFQEETGLPFASCEPGKMHACGHDTHIAMLLGAAKLLQEHREELRGDVRLIFQPAEEHVIGSKAMIAEGALDGVDAIFGQHVWGTLDIPYIDVTAGPRMAYSGRFTVDVIGTSSHAATPHLGADAITGAAAIINNLQQYVSRMSNPLDPVVLTIGTISGGNRYNAIANHVTMEGVTRAYFLDKHEEAMRQIVENTAEGLGMKAVLKYAHVVHPVINDDDDLTEIAQKAVVKLFGEEIAVHAKIVNFQGLSSHADRDHLLAWIADIKAPKPQHVFIVHGDREVAPYFAESVEKLGFTAHAPQYTEVYDLLEDQIVAPGYLPERKAKAVGGQRVSSAYERLVALGQRMVDVIRRSKGRDNKTLGRWADQLRQLLDKWEES